MRIGKLLTPAVLLMIVISFLHLPCSGEGSRADINNDIDVTYWSTGSEWEYEIPIRFSTEMDGNSFVIDITQHVTYTVTGTEDYDVNGTLYDTYRLSGSGTVDGYLLVYGFNVAISGTVSGNRWVTRGSQALVRDENHIDGTFHFTMEDADFMLMINNTNSPPMEYYDFPLNLGEEWHIHTDTYTDGYFWFEGVSIPFIGDINETSDSFEDHRVVDATARCNATASIFVGSSMYDSYQIIQKDKDNNTVADMWYAPEVKNYVKMFMQSFGGGNFSAEPTEINLKDFSLTSEPYAVDFELDPSTAGTGGSTTVSGTTAANADITITIPANGDEFATTSDGDGSFELLIDAPTIPDHTPTSYDVGSHGVIVRVDNGGSVAHAVHTLSLTGPDLFIFPEDVVLTPPVPLVNSQLKINATVHNNDVMAVEDVGVELKIRNLSYNRTIDRLEMNGQGTVAVELDTGDLGAGRHTLTVKVSTPPEMEETDIRNNRVRIHFKVNIPPTSAMNITGPVNYTGEEVLFNGSKSYDPDGKVSEYKWDFGDGNTSGWLKNATTTHSYGDGTKNYTVTLWVKDSDGAESQPVQGDVKILNSPPQAVLKAGGDTDMYLSESNLITLDASDSFDPDGTVVSYKWDFGDGNTSGWTIDADTDHFYARAGTYLAEVWIKDDDNATASANISLVITNTPPEIFVTLSSAEVLTYEDVAVDVNTNDDTGVINITVDLDGDGTWDRWFEGDNGSFSHQWADDGKYTILIQARDDKNGYSQAERTITVLNRAPRAEISSDKTEANLGQTVHITVDQASDMDGTVADSYFTVHGERVNGTELNLSFDLEGTYTVTFTAVDDDGAVTNATVDIVVTNALPVPQFTVSNTTVKVGQEIFLDASESGDPDGTIASYSWDLGDGTNATGVKVNHTYTKAGNYTIALTVIDDHGGRKDLTQEIQVTAPDGDGEGGEGGEVSEKETEINPLHLVLLIIIIIAIIAVYAYYMYTQGKEEGEGEDKEKEGESKADKGDRRAEKGEGKTDKGEGGKTDKGGAGKTDKKRVKKKKVKKGAGAGKAEKAEEEDVGWEFVEDD